MAKKIAVVTGPCGAIGSAIVAQLIKDGLLVVGLDINQAELVEMSKQYSDDFTGIEVDLTDAPAIAQAFKELAKAFGLRSRDFTILSGERSRDKRIQVSGDSEVIKVRYKELCNE